jgi:hypothetical protein
MINAALFDVGETLVDETREYGTWADWLGVPRHTFSAVFGAVVGATPRTGELRRGETIPWRMIAAQIAPRERRGSR